MYVGLPFALVHSEVGVTKQPSLKNKFWVILCYIYVIFTDD